MLRTVEAYQRLPPCAGTPSRKC